jgi:hypothetical protein
VRHKLFCDNGANCPGISCHDVDDGPVVAVSVDTLEWRRSDPTNAPLDECPNNQGKRIFPDKLDPDDASPNRNKVDLVATIQPPVPGVTVYFRVFDVDDPFDQVYTCLPGDDPNNLETPCVSGVTAVDNDFAGPDNRGADSAPGFYQAITDGNGEARVPITLSMQPGNNYRASASLIQEALDQNTLIDGTPVDPQQNADSLSSYFQSGTGRYQPWGDFDGYRVPVVWSRMLTVWRHLWIERDTMAAPDPTELVPTLSINSIFPTPNRFGLTTIQAFNNPSASDDGNNYEEGRVVFTNCPTGSDEFAVVESAGDPNLQFLILLGTPGPCAAAGTGFKVWDDDDLSVLGTPGNPRFPNGGQLLFDAYARAYILPVYAGSAYQDVVPFEDYLNYFEILFGEGSWNSGHDLPSTSAFWSALLVGAWEGTDDEFEVSRNGDGDPDACFNLFSPPPFAGGESPLTGVRRPGFTEAILFLQAIADEHRCTDQTDEEHIFAHELGHTCGVPNMHAHGGIMSEGAPKNENAFTGQSLKVFRERNPW